MKIKVKSKMKKIGSLKKGKVFLHDGKLLMATDVYRGEWNRHENRVYIDLQTGEDHYFRDGDMLVEPANKVTLSVKGG